MNIVLLGLQSQIQDRGKEAKVKMRRGVGPAGTGANVQLAAFGRNLVTFSSPATIANESSMPKK
jgi:hypothetical protein